MSLPNSFTERFGSRLGWERAKTHPPTGGEFYAICKWVR